MEGTSLNKVDSLEETNLETTVKTTFETTLETTLDFDSLTTPDSFSGNMTQDKLTSSSINKSLKIGTSNSSKSLCNSSTLNDGSSEASSSGSSSANNLISSTYVTQEASAIFLVLGDTPELKKYDNTKQLYKNGKNADNFIKNLLMDLQIVLQTKVSKKVSTLKQELFEWEISFLANNDLCSPTPSDYLNNSNISDINKKIGIGKQLLQKWNIPF